MREPEFQLERGLDQGFRMALERLVTSPDAHWLKDVLLHPDLIPAVRTNSLNFYYCGASIFQLARKGDTIIPYTHYKYLVRHREKPEYVGLTSNDRFDYRKDYMWSEYKGADTLNEIMKAAEVYAGPEKTGLHALIKGSVNANVCVLDVEVNFTRDDNNEDGSEDWTEEKRGPGFDRLDVVTLEKDGNTTRLVFHEAKHFSNKELRASKGVVDQIKRYRKAIERHKPSIITTYEKVRRDLEFIATLAQRARGAGAVAKGSESDVRPLLASSGAFEIDPEPRLIIFGFDQDQKEGKAWKAHYERLRAEYCLTVYAVGDPATGKGAFASPRRNNRVSTPR